ncbi:MAG: DUF2219 family protein [Sulfuritalea sp.]|nr:DUF2219 family protein [Sulfuritalea sp.]
MGRLALPRRRGAECRGNRLDTVELDVRHGRPAALGEPVQKAWYRLIGTDTPRGWEHQIPNEPAFVLTYVQKRRFGNDNGDLVSSTAAAAPARC